jgi:SAM-dependent methyltransferase
MSEPYYRADLALVHDRGFGWLADACAPGILRLLEPVREDGGLVLELGCGSGRLTRHLVAAGHRVVATDASPAMLELARAAVGDLAEVRQLVLPDDPLPEVDAVVSVGHAVNYLPDEAAVERALVAMAGALRPGGVIAVDVCDLRWGELRRSQPDVARVEDDWALFTRFSLPRPDCYVREMTTFVRNADGTWRRDDERHLNVLLDTSRIPMLLARHGVEARVEDTVGEEPLPDGLVAVLGRRAG